MEANWCLHTSGTAGRVGTKRGKHNQRSNTHPPVMNQKKATNAGGKTARGSLTISASLILDEVSRRFKGGRRPQITAATPPHSVLPSSPPIEHLPPFTERSSSDRHHQPTEQCPGRMHLTCERSLARLTDHVPLVLLGVGVKRASERASERVRCVSCATRRPRPEG